MAGMVAALIGGTRDVAWRLRWVLFWCAYALLLVAIGAGAWVSAVAVWTP